MDQRIAIGRTGIKYGPIEPSRKNSREKKKQLCNMNFSPQLKHAITTTRKEGVPKNFLIGFVKKLALGVSRVVPIPEQWTPFPATSVCKLALTALTCVGC